MLRGTSNNPAQLTSLQHLLGHGHSYVPKSTDSIWHWTSCEQPGNVSATKEQRHHLWSVFSTPTSFPYFTVLRFLHAWRWEQSSFHCKRTVLATGWLQGHLKECVRLLLLTLSRAVQYLLYRKCQLAQAPVSFTWFTVQHFYTFPPHL